MSAIVFERLWMDDSALIDLSWREVDGIGEIAKAPRSRTMCFAVMDSDEVVSPHSAHRNRYSHCKNSFEGSRTRSQ